MDLRQKYIGEIDSMHLTHDVEEAIRKNYKNLSSDILIAMSYSPVQKLNTLISYGMVVGGVFFSIDVLYETHNNITINDIRKISCDNFLDFINDNQYIKYGL